MTPPDNNINGINSLHNTQGLSGAAKQEKSLPRRFFGVRFAKSPEPEKDEFTATNTGNNKTGRILGSAFDKLGERVPFLTVSNNSGETGVQTYDDVFVQNTEKVGGQNTGISGTSPEEVKEIKRTEKVGASNAVNTSFDYADTAAFSEHLENKIAGQLNDYSEEDIENMIAYIVRFTGVTEDEATEALEKVTQFAGWSQLEEIDNYTLDTDGVYSLYHKSDDELYSQPGYKTGSLNINDLFGYLYHKRQIGDSPVPDKKIFLLDEYDVDNCPLLCDSDGKETIMANSELLGKLRESMAKDGYCVLSADSTMVSDIDILQQATGKRIFVANQEDIPPVSDNESICPLKKADIGDLKEIKEHFANKMFFLDDAQLDDLEQLKSANAKEYYDLIYMINSGKVIPAYIDGWDAKVDGINICQNMFGCEFPPEESAIELIRKMKQTGQTADEVLNGNIRQRIREILGDDIEQRTICITNEKTAPDKIRTIAENCSTNHTKKEYVRATIDTIVGKLGEGYDKTHAKELLSRYFDTMIMCNSSKSTTEKMQRMHSQILAKVKEQGKNPDDILYVIPSSLRKSFDLVSYQYAKVNGIDPSKFVRFNGINMCQESAEGERIYDTDVLKGKTLVILDDIVGSGDSMLDSEFHYRQFRNNSEFNNTLLIFAPLVSLQQGVNNINQTINAVGMPGDTVIPGSIADYKKFEATLSDDDKHLLAKMLGKSGYSESFSCIAMPYMLPDNNSDASGLLLSEFLRNNDTDEANKSNKMYLEYGEEVKKREIQYLKEQESSSA